MTIVSKVRLPSPARAPRRSAQAASEDRERVVAMLECARSAGLKLTPQRMAIVRELAADPTHPTAQELYERLRKTQPTMSFATVYNTLDALAKAGLCAALSLAPGAARFDPNMRLHHHAVCDSCGLVRDVACAPPAAPRSAESTTLEAAPGFALRAVEHIYRGLCAACARGDAGVTRTARAKAVAEPRDGRRPGAAARKLSSSDRA